MGGNLERNAFALAGAVVGGAVFIGVLRNPQGIRALGDTYFGGLTRLAGTLARG